MRLTPLDKAIAALEAKRDVLEVAIAELKALRGPHAGKKLIKPARPVAAKESA